ncbi:MAG: cell division protein FtsW [Verrucomicrobiales bacterium]|jgi:cell division protein FtsW
MTSEFAKRSAHLLVVAVLTLLGIGLVMLISTSVWGAEAKADDVYFDARRQLLWIAIGILLCIGAACVDYHVLKRYAWVGYIAAIALLAACFLPNVGLEINGESRWISARELGFDFRFQPSEIGKFALVVLLAAWFARHSENVGEFWLGFAMPGLFAAIILGLIILEVDIGSTLVLSGAVAAMMFIGGSSLRFLSVGGILAIVVVAFLISTDPIRMERVDALFHPELYEQTTGHQQRMALLAIGSGGVEGLGLGMGRMKMMYMPFAHTDFIFPMIGEELGVGATMLVVFCFIAITILGLAIAMHAPDRFGKLLGVGIVMCISIQAIVNIGVTTRLLPNTGLPLPFVSYGGSHLLVSLVGVGCLLNIYRQGRLHERAEPLLAREKRITLARG